MKFTKIYKFEGHYEGHPEKSELFIIASDLVQAYNKMYELCDNLKVAGLAEFIRDDSDPVEVIAFE